GRVTRPLDHHARPNASTPIFVDRPRVPRRRGTLLMDREKLHLLTATEAVRLLREGALGALEYMGACLARVREVDGQVQAWASLDPDTPRAQARVADEYRLSGQPIGPLHGVPVGIKDIIDTGDMPTENGSVLHAGRTPSRDAAVVALLRAAGAVIMGK